MTLAVDLGDRRAGLGERAGDLRAGVDLQLGAVDLAADRDPLGREAEHRRQPPAVLEDGVAARHR